MPSLQPVRHLLVTNDYPPKVGGIQSYLWELYRRLPADEFVVLTRPYPGWERFDAEQDHTIVRARQRFLVPEPWLAREIRAIVDRHRIDLVVYDPAVPVGALGPRMGLPYGVILHGAEVTVPGRLPGTRRLLGDVLRKAELVVSAGAYCAGEAQRAAGRPLPGVVVPPGVDTERFHPLDSATRSFVRAQYGFGGADHVVLTLSRLVPRKGMDRLIEAAAQLRRSDPHLVVVVAGAGRDRARLERLAARVDAPVRFLGRVPDVDKPHLYAAADVFAMLCRVRWGGLEQEGFGIVFVEAAACGVPQLAGRSGGAAEAVTHGSTGLVVEDPDNVDEIARSLGQLLDDAETRAAMAVAARARAVQEFEYSTLAERFHQAVGEAVHRLARPAHELA
jgi:phosphatidylinositol alpha-1,6-mannosyltransferase